MYLGLDFGTSGARACVINDSCDIVHTDRIAYCNATAQSPQDWREALHALLRQLPIPIAAQLQRISIDATSATVLLCDGDLQPISPALLYHDTRAQTQAEALKTIAPNGHIVCSASSGLAKFLWLTQHIELDNAVYFLHQADWLSALLTGTGGTSDYHNALKSGYDVEHLCWPEWIMQLPHSHLLPHVTPPGSFVAELAPSLAQHFNINRACTIHAGTTDSIAAFIAADVHESGAAVTSLGTTLVLKLLSETRVEDVRYGIYSHRYGDCWLAGGASNAGGGVLRQYFSDEQLTELSRHIDTTKSSTLDYYPLPKPGERFPYNDPKLAARLSPRPSDDAQFLHGILQGLSRIEADGYKLLAKLGATPLKSVSSSGGGADNAAWNKIRQQMLKIPVTCVFHDHSATDSTRILPPSPRTFCH